ncbi:MAG: tRNA (N(6)-L-threonylcarbamoyladenosine(37)-C(2))-methylthiotransferase [Candidatus Aenigmarchaeota archaeon]|nr:tRNA (N(6)-L-threonylcarbamoyladenosine(37)-C(2))-methylthiotransferase [Candidatus Aenigmarchaeota archaeon]
MRRVYIETYGCSANQSQSEVIAGLLTKYGYNIVDSESNADAVIVNSCVVKAVTEQKILYRLETLAEKFPDSKLVVTGCFVDAGFDRLATTVPNASFVSTHKTSEFARVMDKIFGGGRVRLLEGEEKSILGEPKLRHNKTVHIVPIATGCTGHCTYCATKIAKGEIKSYPKVKILQDIEKAVQEGCKEVWITGQDTGAYGFDKYGESRLHELLGDITKIRGDFRVRVGMLNINNIKDKLPELMGVFNNRKMYKFFHLPMQSGDNEILKTMGRQYTAEEFIEVVDEIKKVFKITLWTDVIVGFPGETEEQFKNTIKVLKRIDSDFANISRYAMRPNTPAQALQQIPTDVMKERTRVMTNLVLNYSLIKNKEWIGWKGDILISKKGDREGQWIGRNFSYKKIIINKSGNQLGKFLRVKIIDAVPTALIGWPLREESL